MKTKINGHSDLVRDSQSKAVLNTDSNALLNAKLAKQARQEKIDRLNKVEKDVSEIKELLETLIKNTTKKK